MLSYLMYLLFCFVCVIFFGLFLFSFFFFRQKLGSEYIHMPTFLDLQIPNWYAGESPGSTKVNPFPLPEPYSASQTRNVRCYKLLPGIGLDFSCIRLPL